MRIPQHQHSSILEIFFSEFQDFLKEGFEFGKENLQMPNVGTAPFITLAGVGFWKFAFPGTCSTGRFEPKDRLT